MEAIFDELLNRHSECNQFDECYDLAVFPSLNLLIAQKIADAKYVSIELQNDPDSKEIVFSLILYDAEEEQVGGCDLTKTQIIWDDE
jgi:hypothetical protein